MSEGEKDISKDMNEFINKFLNELIKTGAGVEKAYVYNAETGESSELNINDILKPKVVWKDTNDNVLELGDTVTWRNSPNSIGKIVGFAHEGRRMAISWTDNNKLSLNISPENSAINVTLIEKNTSLNPCDIGALGIAKYLATKVTLDNPTVKDGEDAPCDCKNCVAVRYIDKYSAESGLTDKEIIREIADNWDNVFNSSPKPSDTTATAIEEADKILTNLPDPAVIEVFKYIVNDGSLGTKGFHDLERAKKWAAGMEIEYNRPFNVYTLVQR